MHTYLVISVENFYWVIYHNLLRPVGLDCWYYYPFGSMDTLSHIGVFKPRTPKAEHHVLFHFDQEPIWQNSLGPLYEISTLASSRLILKILANSEHSAIKKKVCKDHDMLDWYFFYHGFAALSWFADSRFISDHGQVSNAFLCMNHLIEHRRSYRIALTAKLAQRDLLRQGSVSFHGTQQQCRDEIQRPYTQISQHNREIINRWINNKPDLPILLDRSMLSGTASADFSFQDHSLWQKSLFHVVTETVYYEDKLHLTEKIFKPIVCMRPFLLLGSAGSLAYLRDYGFKTFGAWIDETYDSILDPDQRLDAVINEIEKLCELSVQELRALHHDMIGVLEFNKKHFFSDFRTLIVSEMLANFDTCLRQWNNGRVDGRTIPLHPDMASVKRALLL